MEGARLVAAIAAAAVFLLSTVETSLAAPGNVTKAPPTRERRYTGCYVVLYEHYNYRGRSLTVHGQISDLRHHAFDNLVSSAKVYGSCHWIFYEHWYYGDPSILSPGSYPSPQAWGQPDNILTSLRALPPSGTTAIALFEHEYFTGRMLVLQGSSSNLHYHIFGDIISGAIVTGGTWRLYEHPYYTGSSYTLGPGHHISYRHDYVSSIKLN